MQYLKILVFIFYAFGIILDDCCSASQLSSAWVNSDQNTCLLLYPSANMQRADIYIYDVSSAHIAEKKVLLAFDKNKKVYTFTIDNANYTLVLRSGLAQIHDESRNKIFEGREPSSEFEYESIVTKYKTRYGSSVMSSDDKFNPELYYAKYKMQSNSIRYKNNYLSVLPKFMPILEARAKCQAQGGDLFAIENMEDYNVLYFLNRINGYRGTYLNAVRKKNDEWVTFDDKPLPFEFYQAKNQNAEYNYGLAATHKTDNWEYIVADINDGSFAFACYSPSAIRAGKPSENEATAIISEVFAGFFVDNDHKFILEILKDSNGKKFAIWRTLDKYSCNEIASLKMDFYKDEGTSFTLVGREWIRRPPSYIFVHLEVSKDGDFLDGILLGKLRGSKIEGYKVK